MGQYHSNIYTRSVKTVRRYDGSGKQLWLKTQAGLNTIVVQDMTGDSSDNLYISGKYQASSGNFNAFARKLNAGGSVLWTKTYGTPSTTTLGASPPWAAPSTRLARRKGHSLTPTVAALKTAAAPSGPARTRIQKSEAPVIHWALRRR